MPTDPVVSRVSGCLFERRLVEKYIAETGRCPKTGESLRKEDLIAVAGGAAAPRLSPSVGTIPGLLQTLHHEWDALMLEQFTLRQQLTQCHQELSHALFQHDAACRVIAKLIQERDALKKMVGSGAGASSAANEEDNDEDVPVLPIAVCDAIDEHERRLKDQRKHRDAPRTLARPECVKRFVEFDSASIHSNAAVTAIDAAESASGGKSFVSGGADGRIVRYDMGRRAVCGTGVGHRKAVRAVKDLGDVIVSVSDDTTLRVWRSEGDAIATHLVVKTHQAPVNALCVLPGDQHVVTADDGGKFILSDIVKGFTIHTAESEHTRLGISCAALHPDGAVAATGSAGSVLLWDVKMMDVHVKLTPPSGRGGAIRSVAFNDDGVTLAAGTNTGTVVLWDLRNINEPLSVLAMSDVAIAKPTPINKISFDRHGSYLAVGLDTLRIWQWREKKELATLSSHLGPITDVSWGRDAKWIVTSSLDKTVRMFGSD